MAGHDRNPDLAAQMVEARALQASFQGGRPAQGARGSRGGRHTARGGRADRATSPAFEPGRPQGAPLRPTQIYPAHQRRQDYPEQGNQLPRDDYVANFFGNPSSPERGTVTYYDQNGQGDVIVPDHVDNNGNSKRLNGRSIGSTYSTQERPPTFNDGGYGAGGRMPTSRQRHMMSELSHDPAIRDFFDNDEDVVRGTVNYYQDAPNVKAGQISQVPSNGRAVQASVGHCEENLMGFDTANNAADDGFPLQPRQCTCNENTGNQIGYDGEWAKPHLQGVAMACPIHPCLAGTSFGHP